MVRILDPGFASQRATPRAVEDFFNGVPPIREHTDLAKLKQQLPAYQAAAVGMPDRIDRDDVDKFSDQVLDFWKNASRAQLGEWIKAARVIFSMSPNSASCERVFSLLQSMYGLQRARALSDHLQASLMMRFNKRGVYEN